MFSYISNGINKFYQFYMFIFNSQIHNGHKLFQDDIKLFQVQRFIHTIRYRSTHGFNFGDQF